MWLCSLCEGVCCAAVVPVVLPQVLLCACVGVCERHPGMFHPCSHMEALLIVAFRLYTSLACWLSTGRGLLM